MAANPEEDEGEEEEVVQDEVGTDIGGGGDVGLVVGEEVPDIADLEYEDDEPYSVTLLERAQAKEG